MYAVRTECSQGGRMAKQKALDARMEIRLPRDLARAAQRAAKQVQKPLAEVIRELLARWVKNPEGSA